MDPTSAGWCVIHFLLFERQSLKPLPLQSLVDAADEELWGSQYVAAFLANLVKYRAKDFMVSLMEFLVNNVMQQYADASQKTAELQSRKFGALDLLAALSSSIKKSKAMKPHLEQIVAVHVIPELRSSALFLRAKACQVFSVYYDIDFQSPQIFITGLEYVLADVTDDNECVKGLATIALHLLVKSSLSREVVKHVLPNVIDVVFNLVDSLDNEAIVKTLETLISVFPDAIAARAVDAVRRLSEHWFRLVRLAKSDPNDDMSAVTAIQIGGAIATLCDACSKVPQIYPQLEPFIIPICETVLREQMTEYLDEIVKILVFLSLHESPVSPAVWSCFPPICHMLTSWAADYVPECLAIFDNLIARSTDTFLSSGALDMALGIFNAYVTDPNRSEYSAGNASQIMEVILVYCRGRVDSIVPHAITTALQRFSTAKTSTLRALCLEVVANAIIYNPTLALTFLEHNNFTNEFFAQWLNAIIPPPKPQKKKKRGAKKRVQEAAEPSPFVRLHDKQVCIMALSSIFQISITTLPPSIQQYLSRTFPVKLLPPSHTNLMARSLGILACILKLQDEFEVQRVMMAESEDGEEDEEEDESTHPDAAAPADHVDLLHAKSVKFDFEEAEDDDDEVDNDGSLEEDGFDDDDDDGFFHLNPDEEGNYGFADNADAEDQNERFADELLERMAMAHEDEFDLDDDDDFSSQLDEVDPVIFFIDAMHTLTQRDGAAAQQLIASLSAQQQKMLNNLDAEAARRRSTPKS